MSYKENLWTFYTTRSIDGLPLQMESAIVHHYDSATEGGDTAVKCPNVFYGRLHA